MLSYPAAIPLSSRSLNHLAGEALFVELLAEDLQHHATQLRRRVTGSARQVLSIASGAASAAPTPAGQIAGGVLAVLASLVHGPRQRKPITLFRINKTEPPTAFLPAGPPSSERPRDGSPDRAGP
ncbi:hypothetical protein EV384_4961 [Micromonospora kangleipakensis]|uniref:Uncharacterized protein n=1 Tax=Micromonospora kangleipakensis TaxID=1077942 RepID=A0A4Q8BFW8_9ACTN|nr:hypothetical protein EV384_4961 [Micromonospora kangleipakensis]